jgi:hypothetical protein
MPHEYRGSDKKLSCMCICVHARGFYILLLCRYLRKAHNIEKK